MTLILPSPGKTLGVATGSPLNSTELNGMSLDALRTYHEQERFRCGAIRLTIRRPDSKLRDIARIAFGATADQMRGLGANAIASLFFERNMTFSLENIAAMLYRLGKEDALERILNCNYQFYSEDVRFDHLLAHDNEGRIVLARIEHLGQHKFHVEFQHLHDGPLFEGQGASIILRHWVPGCLWRIMQLDPEPESPCAGSPQKDPAGLLGHRMTYQWDIGRTLTDLESQWPEAVKFKKKATSSLAKAEPGKCGVAVWERNRSQSESARYVFGTKGSAGLIASNLPSTGFAFGMEEFASIVVAARERGFAYPNGSGFSAFVEWEKNMFHIWFQMHMKSRVLITVRDPWQWSGKLTPSSDKLLLKLPAGIQTQWQIDIPYE